MVSPKFVGFVLLVAAAAPAAAQTASALGEALFQRNFVFASPASRRDDGLGPMYDARSCTACHAQGAATALAHENGVPVGTVIRLGNGQVEGDPVYGVQV